MKNPHFLSRREFLRLAAIVAGSQVLSACTNSTKSADGPKEDNTAQSQPAPALPFETYCPRQATIIPFTTMCTK